MEHHLLYHRPRLRREVQAVRFPLCPFRPFLVFSTHPDGLPESRWREDGTPDQQARHRLLIF